MTVKQVTKIVPNIVECGSCNCKNAFICIASEATPELVPGLFALPATISGCKAIYEVVGETVEKDSCGRTVVSKVMKISTELTLSYESTNFVNSTDALSTDDISCVSTDSCMVRTIQAVIDFINTP